MNNIIRGVSCVLLGSPGAALIGNFTPISRRPAKCAMTFAWIRLPRQSTPKGHNARPWLGPAMLTPVQPAAHAVAAYQTYRLNFSRNKNRLWPPLDSFSVLGLLSKFVGFLCFSSPIDCNCLNQQTFWIQQKSKQVCFQRIIMTHFYALFRLGEEHLLSMSIHPMKLLWIAL